MNHLQWHFHHSYLQTKLQVSNKEQSANSAVPHWYEKEADLLFVECFGCGKRIRHSCAEWSTELCIANQ